MSGDKDDVKAHMVDAGPVTPHNAALYEAGKALLVESISVGRDFCKDMISVCAGAMPIYFALLTFVLPKEYSLDLVAGVVDLIPSVLFLAAMIVFVLGYLPQAGTLSLDYPDEIERERDRTARRRQTFAQVGLVLFCLGVVAGIGTTTNALATRQQVSTIQPKTNPGIGHPMHRGS
jgi:hypothetical protein